ncbi:vacuolar protein sorting-associated protein 55-like [Citrus sinensis]|uniref:Vacuolar protein sorting-associated protein 55-like n=1 Tax=Citrus sinensis TaxID=2711 RepID=A0ACB8L8R2_CITSI|nr:vacuolar protein sorting-associated protein 55-like [Citrus sinensis]
MLIDRCPLVCCKASGVMADLPGYMRACLHTGKLAFLAILVSGGIVLQILACALYNNWWPMLTVLMYVLLPMPLLFFAGSNGSSLFSESENSWVNATKFLTGASAVGSIAIPVILKHAGVIGWGALAMELSSFFVITVQKCQYKLKRVCHILVEVLQTKVIEKLGAQAVNMANNIGTAAMEAQEEQQVQISDDDEILDVEDDSSFDSIVVEYSPLYKI